VRSAGKNPALRPWRVPAKPAAQNKEAPTPQVMPTAIELKRLFVVKRPPLFKPQLNYHGSWCHLRNGSRCKCPLMTQSGHAYPLLRPPILLGFKKRYHSTAGGGLRAQAGFHQSHSRLGTSVAAHEPRATVCNPGHWIFGWRNTGAVRDPSACVPGRPERNRI